jgi:hypothetical protein
MTTVQRRFLFVVGGYFAASELLDRLWAVPPPPPTPGVDRIAATVMLSLVVIAACGERWSAKGKAVRAAMSEPTRRLYVALWTGSLATLAMLLGWDLAMGRVEGPLRSVPLVLCFGAMLLAVDQYAAGITQRRARALRFCGAAYGSLLIFESLSCLNGLFHGGRIGRYGPASVYYTHPILAAFLALGLLVVGALFITGALRGWTVPMSPVHIRRSDDELCDALWPKARSRADGRCEW